MREHKPLATATEDGSPCDGAPDGDGQYINGDMAR